MGKSARYKPLRTDVRPGSRLYSYGGRYPDRFCTLVRLTRSKMVVAIDNNDVDKRCVNCESFTNAANAPIPDPASQSVPAPAPAALLRPAPPLPAPIWPSVTLHGSAYPNPFLPHPPNPTDSLLVRGSLVPVCELIKQEPVLHHRFLLCCTSFAAAGVDPGTGFPAFLHHINMAPQLPSAIAPRTGPPVAASRLPSPLLRPGPASQPFDLQPHRFHPLAPVHVKMPASLQPKPSGTFRLPSPISSPIFQLNTTRSSLLSRLSLLYNVRLFMLPYWFTWPLSFFAYSSTRRV